MPIIVTCLCGSQFRVPDEAAEKQMLCPVCARPALVPSLEVGRSAIADRLPAAGQARCADCRMPFWPKDMVNDGGELVCRRCFEVGPPKKPMSPTTRKALIIGAAVIAVIGVNAALAYVFFFRG